MCSWRPGRYGTPVDSKIQPSMTRVIARYRNGFPDCCEAKEVQYIDVAPKPDGR